jgi:hypothetical protein
MTDCVFINVGDKIQYKDEKVEVLQLAIDGVYVLSEKQDDEIFITCGEILKYNEEDKDE